MNDDYSKRDTQIWLTEWTFFNLDGTEFIAPDEDSKVVCKKIPLRFIINEGLCYGRAIKNLSITTMKTLQDDKKTGLKKFKIKYIKFISKVN